MASDRASASTMAASFSMNVLASCSDAKESWTLYPSPLADYGRGSRESGEAWSAPVTQLALVRDALDVPQPDELAVG